jgi:uncharacterized protein YdiU (UPF0061 family)
MSITGESFDYGPWRFLPRYDASFVAAYFDPMGLYAYGSQPEIVRWNLEALADALSQVAPPAELAGALSGFADAYRTEHRQRFLERLGVRTRGPEADDALVAAATGFLSESYVGFDQFFFDWYGGGASAARRALGGLAARHYAGARFEAMRERLTAYDPAHPHRLSDPYFRRDRPCSMLIQEVEEIWHAIAEHDDWSRFERKIGDIRAMAAAYGRAPAAASPQGAAAPA